MRRVKDINGEDEASRSAKTRQLISFSRKLALKFLHPSGGINKSLLTGVSGVRIHSNITDMQKMINTFSILGIFRCSRWFGHEFFTCRNIGEANRMVGGMNIFFHNWSALPSFKSWVCFVDYIKSTFPADNFAIGMTILERFDWWCNFHYSHLQA